VRKRAVKARWAIAIVAIICAGIVVRDALIHPLWMPASGVRAWLLRRAPLGSSPEQVDALIAAHRWSRHYDWHGTPSHSSEEFYPAVKGSRIIGAQLGGYQGIPFRADLDAYWGFDESGHLIDLNVRKMVDAL
jgi:hypothetical protein